MKLVKLIKMGLNKTYSKVHIGTNLTDAFSTLQWSETDTLLPLLFNLALEYAIRN